MNNNMFQTILTVLITASGFATAAMQYFGCTAVDCSAAPVWIAPYLVIAMPILGFAKLVIAYLEGKLIAPTVVVDSSGLPGTVTPDQVAEDLS
jgi:hypothetical protein